MLSAADPLNEALFAALVAANTIVDATGNAVAIYDRVPDGAAFPFLQIGDNDVTFDVYQGSSTSLAHVNIHVFSRYVGRMEVNQIAANALTVLNYFLPVNGFETQSHIPEQQRNITEKEGDVLTEHAIVSIEYRLRALN
jgi:hypothetical protein